MAIPQRLPPSMHTILDPGIRFNECLPGRRKLAIKVVDIYGNDTMKIIEVMI